MDYPGKRYTGNKPWMNKEWLYEQYVLNDRSSKDIAEEFGCKQNTIQQWLRKHGIKKPILTHHRTKKKYEAYDFLYHEHIELGKSIRQIADECGVSYDTIRENLIKARIQIQKRNAHKQYSKNDIELMKYLYVDKAMSASQVARELGTSHRVVIKYLQNAGIDTRSMSEAQLNHAGKTLPQTFYDAELLRKMHWDDRISCKDIGELFGVAPGTVRRQLHRLGIETRSNSESKVGVMTGEQHPNWRGGMTSLKNLLREYFHVNHAPVIAARDNYTCQLCGANHSVLHVHHKRGFGDIVDEICAEHSDLDHNDEKDRLELYRIITHDSRFLDESNLITYCKQCHYFKIHNYQKRKSISSQASDEEGSETIP